MLLTRGPIQVTRLGVSRVGVSNAAEAPSATTATSPRSSCRLNCLQVSCFSSNMRMNSRCASFSSRSCARDASTAERRRARSCACLSSRCIACTEMRSWSMYGCSRSVEPMLGACSAKCATAAWVALRSFSSMVAGDSATAAARSGASATPTRRTAGGRCSLKARSAAATASDACEWRRESTMEERESCASWLSCSTSARAVDASISPESRALFTILGCSDVERCSAAATNELWNGRLRLGKPRVSSCLRSSESGCFIWTML
mmetsp:Transcript_3233/g.8004  ORF Transcript_3233/g.8004 Transcript_3233/m.8004 type:complete len:262 (+) Transcript_3233:341-1126(+)